MKKIITLLVILGFLVSCSKEDTTEVNNSNIKLANQKGTGSSSNDLLSDTTFKSMVIELVYVEGFEPSQNSISNFVNFLNSRTFKPNGITVEKRAIPSPGNAPYSNQEIIDIEDANRSKYNTSNQVAVWAFFADGESENNTNSGIVLGTAYRNTSFVIYEATIQDLSNSAFEPNRTVLETTVITHELGHILGLTNLGTTMVNNHEDTEHAKHCNIESCLMYWAAESGSDLSNLMGSNTAPQLDAQCIADLQANGGK
ncbi:membrane metalloprotease [Mariniflexile litorale]|uniref:Membrane metalloprotease n=1 Tax=Mariniflexile litorale TaxID=3045158 RepID=A0AAU7EHF7_9FLAO|nr:membrane metalloprotease [Mariniflexile sp. KMM 9835]MDQ8210058.1 membrane metalloprotease [Mariniflexile sp. KMM 9835]